MVMSGKSWPASGTKATPRAHTSCAGNPPICPSRNWMAPRCARSKPAMEHRSVGLTSPVRAQHSHAFARGHLERTPHSVCNGPSSSSNSLGCVSSARAIARRFLWTRVSSLSEWPLLVQADALQHRLGCSATTNTSTGQVSCTTAAMPTRHLAWVPPHHRSISALSGSRWVYRVIAWGGF
jgi:hypothetical protein